MQKYYRIFPLFVLFVAIAGCSGKPSDSKSATTEPNSKPAETIAQAPQTKAKKAAAQPSQVAAKTEDGSNPDSKPQVEPEKNKGLGKAKTLPSPKQSSEAKNSSAQSAKTDPSPPLPELSEKNKALVSQVTKEIQEESTLSTQNTGLTTVSRILVAQQAMWLLSGEFSDDFKALEPNLPIEDDDYTFSITKGDRSESVIMAIAKSDKLPSFTGATVAVPSKVPQSALCRTKLPSKTPPQTPTIKDGRISCGNDGVLIDF